MTTEMAAKEDRHKFWVFEHGSLPLFEATMGGQNRLEIAILVFCYQNCSDLLLVKNVLVIEKNF